MHLEPGKLTWEAASELAPMIREQDRMECIHGPFEALCRGMSAGGDAWTAIAVEADEHKFLGAFGYTKFGTIWSLWRELTLVESVAVLRMTPLWVRTMLDASGQPMLFNFVWADNSPAIGWLEASRCFKLNYAQPANVNGLRHYAFRTRPHEELPSV